MQIKRSIFCHSRAHYKSSVYLGFSVCSVFLQPHRHWQLPVWTVPVSLSLMVKLCTSPVPTDTHSRLGCGASGPWTTRKLCSGGRHSDSYLNVTGGWTRQVEQGFLETSTLETHSFRGIQATTRREIHPISLVENKMNKDKMLRTVWMLPMMGNKTKGFFKNI